MAEVTLQVYDLSGGMVKMFSMGIIGKQIDGIWHTSVVVFGREYYFGGGICSDIPLSTPYGTPVERHRMGVTQKSPADFQRFLQAVSHRFTMDSYHIISHNCNNFTDECMRFLLDKSIPSHITGLPQELLSTPIGQQFAPMINQMMTMKESMFGQMEAVKDHYEDYASHEMYFGQYKKIDGYPDYDKIAKNTGVVIFWDPRHDESLGLAQIVQGLKIEFAFCDTLRNFYMAPESVPLIRLFVNGDVLNDYSVQEFSNSLADIYEILGIS